MINPVFLRTFMTLADTRHFTHTAEQLHMTQPGVSQHVKKLEAELGVALIERYGKRFELTEAGERLLEYGERQSHAEIRLRDDITGDDPYAGECRIACSGSMAMLLYPQLLRSQQQRPKLSFSVEAAPNERIIERIKTNTSDLGIITQPVYDAEMTSECIGEDSLCLVLPAGSITEWDSLQQLGFVNHPDGHHYATQVFESNYPNQFKGMDALRQSSYINQLSQILLPVSEGLGFTVIPKSSLDAFPYQDKIRSAELPVPVNEAVYMVTKKHRPLPRRYQEVKALLIKQWR